MKRQFSYLLSLLPLALLLLSACGDRTPVINLEQDNSTRFKENMINANRVVIQSESTQIQGYIQRRGMEATALPCGALYYEYTHGKGSSINPDDTVIVSYRLEALDGTPFYTHQTDTLVVGRRQVTVALDDLLQAVPYGSQAWLIAPSNTAYGVAGDGDRVPSRTVIIYNIESINKIYSKKS
ncbi:MAG: FKBP-type peptidyl-prolyl cis-trans isomerase [Bacteroidales bacterium]|nr:FKBP-type peptidyl-prolyl cis-trans isomerase [Bacteroidales bacterium]